MFDNEILFPERAKFYGKGPADCAWPKSQPVTAITISRPTNHDGEAMQITVPVFAEDTHEDLRMRFHVLSQIGDKRMNENNQALLKSEELLKELKMKKELEAKAHSATLVAMKKAAKSGDVKAVHAIAGGTHDKAPDHSGSTQPS